MGKRMKKFLSTFLIIIFLLIVLLSVVVILSRLVNSLTHKIGTSNGIQQDTYIQIGGIRQYVQIRGKDKDNPVILFLHGGPGSTQSFLSYSFQTGLEDDYTIVHWDQRGCGRTYYENEERAGELKKEFTYEQLLADTDQLVDYLMERFEQDEVIILGHSWGSVLGSTYSIRHPEKVTAYIGVGQLVNFQKGNIVLLETTMKQAGEQGNSQDAAAMKEAIAQYQEWDTNTMIDLKLLNRSRSLTAPYFSKKGQVSMPELTWKTLTAPTLAMKDLRWAFVTLGNQKKFMDSQEPLLQAMFTYDAGADAQYYNVPVCLISGEDDAICPTAMTETYFENLEAPKKEMVVMQDSGHYPHLDDSAVFCRELKKALRKIT